ncbi:MAG: hypothetical protein AB7G13_21505 [Lautropia sp.]
MQKPTIPITPGRIDIGSLAMVKVWGCRRSSQMSAERMFCLRIADPA